MELDKTIGRIVTDISKETGITEREVHKALTLFFKGIKEEIVSDIPVHIRMPFLGTIIPKGEYIKRYETNNIRGGIPSIQSGSSDDKGIQSNN